MKFKEIFKEDYCVNWDLLLTIPQFSKMVGLEQNKNWHNEDCWTHTRLVTEQMERTLDNNNVVKGSEDWIMCMMAALCHDLGKAETTKWSEEKQDWTTKNHGVVGERITRNLFYDEDIIQREKVCYMVRHHMTLHHIFDEDDEAKRKLVKLSHGIVPIRYMVYLNVADSKGSLNDIETEEKINTKGYKVCAYASVLNCFDKPYSYIAKDQLIRDFIKDDSELVNKTSDFCVYILCGFPGCGKSTYYNLFLDKKAILSRDIIRGELGIGGATTWNDKKVVGTKEEENKVSEIFNKRMIEYCENKESFVIDNTNLKYQYRKDYLLKIMKYNPKVKIIYVEAPNFINDCMKRREGEIPKSVYDRMNDGFDFPQLYECDELVIYKEHNDEDKVYTFSGTTSPQTLPIETRILNDLRITRGAMILDGYDTYDSCIKYMDDLIKKYDKK